jgi:hypothetical protein
MKDPIMQEFNGKLWISVEHHMNAVEYAMEICAEAEREECAKVLDAMAKKDKLSNYYKVAANAIRARGQE